jgi:hypothetical protein
MVSHNNPFPSSTTGFLSAATKLWKGRVVMAVLIAVISLSLTFLVQPLALSTPPILASTTMYPFGSDTLVRGQSYQSSWLSVSDFYGMQASWVSAGISTFRYRTDVAPQWVAIEEDADAEPGIALPVFFSGATQVQVEVVVNEGSVSTVRLDFVDPGESAQVSQVHADGRVLSRSDWGADESLRLRETRDRIIAEAKKKAAEAAPKPTATPKPTPIPTPAKPTEDGVKQPTEASEYGANCSLLQAKYPEEFKVSQVISSDAAGKAYTWPVAYTQRLRKIVVHHTDTDIKDYDQNGVVDSSDYKVAVRAIYYFHTISRDWGDIGYNYLIDPAGTIYEGRAGGDLAIGAHSLCKNNGALGIALIGNFQGAAPTAEALSALQSLVSIKGQAYSIDIQGMSTFYGSYMPNVVGHRNVRATSCPGDQLYTLLPSLRSATLATIQQYTFPSSSPTSQGRAVAHTTPSVSPIGETQNVYRAEPQKFTEVLQVAGGSTVKPTVTFKNTGTTIWNEQTVIRPLNLASGVTLMRQALQQQTYVSPHDIATFIPELAIDPALSGKVLVIEFYVVPNNTVELPDQRVKINVQVAISDKRDDISLNGVPLDKLKTVISQNAIATQLQKSTESVSKFISEEIGGDQVSATQAAQLMRIKLTAPDSASSALVSSDAALIVDNQRVRKVQVGTKVTVIRQDGGLTAKVGSDIYQGAVIRLVPEDGDGKVTLTNLSNVPPWNTLLNDNVFRGTMEWRVIASKLVTINELPLELYLRGLAEVSNTAHPEKQKTMAIIARSYALYYLTRDQKFPGQPYTLDDDPRSSQKYLGYGYEIRSPNFVDAVIATKGQVVAYQNQVVKTPYFNKSDGRTRSAEEVWGWKDTPYLVSVADPLCQSDEPKLLGHGVGLSGCGADGAAARGYTTAQILQYYYPGTTILSL